MTQVNFEQILQDFSPLASNDLPDTWQILHQGDREQLPENEDEQLAWLAFHNGEFLRCATLAESCGWVSLQLKALSTYAHYIEQTPDEKIKRFKDVVARAEQALVTEEKDRANLYYQVAYSLGRYGQYISVAKALSEGIAGQIEKALNDCLSLQPNHADAHTAMATYQAEIIGKLGKMAARLTYSVNVDSAIELYERGIELAPDSVSAKTEYADGLLTMFGRKKIDQAVGLYEEADRMQPKDVLQAMDAWLAHQELAEA